MLASLAVLLLASFFVGVAPASAYVIGLDGPALTEDNDTNDNGTANNVSDDGDNEHPSGKDRSVENGKSGTQGKSTSDPDGASNGGPDKADGTGGVDKADQDGNNGCGNDDDFEDDNNGNCGGSKEKDSSSPCVKAHGKSAGKGKSKSNHKCSAVLTVEVPCKKAMPASSSHDCGEANEADKVASGSTSKPCSDDATMGDSEKCGDLEVMALTDSATPAEGDDVLGLSLANPAVAADAIGSSELPDGVLGSALPFTGAGIVPFIAVAIVLLGAGFLLMRTRKSTS